VLRVGDAETTMPKRNNKRLGTKTERKNLPLLKFEESVRALITDFARTLPTTFTGEDLAREIDLYLDHASKTIRLPVGGRRQIRTMEIGKHLDPRFAGRDFELLNQDDFKQWAEPLLTDDNFLILDAPMQALRKRSSELGLDWARAETTIRTVAGEFRPDDRSERVKRGDLCERVISEVKEIRRRRADFRSFEELEPIFPGYQTVRFLKSRPFDAEDRDTLAHPNRWETTPLVYAYGLLKRSFDVSSDHTITKYRKTFKAYSKSRKAGESSPGL